MYQAMNSTVLDGQPVLGASPAMSLYFIVFILICVYFILNLLIGVAIDQVGGSVARHGQAGSY